MINEIIVLPRLTLENWIKAQSCSLTNKRWALISIYEDCPLVRTFKDDEIIKNLGCVEVSSHKFSDVTDDQYERNKNSMNLFLFNSDIAKSILSFIERVKDQVEILVIHCAAGISRSGAVGVFVCRYLGLNESEFRKKNPSILPNPFVYETLYQVSGMRDDYQNFWDNLDSFKRRDLLIQKIRANRAAEL